jgi:hypothetical protein
MSLEGPLLFQWEEPGPAAVVLKSVDRKRPLRKGQSFTFYSGPVADAFFGSMDAVYAANEK